MGYGCLNNTYGLVNNQMGWITPPSAAYPTRGLIARYSFDDNLIDSYDSKGDLTQYGVGTQYWAYSADKPSGITGKSCKLGTNDRLGSGLKNATDASVYGLANGTSVFSVSMWGKIDNTGQDLAALWSLYATGSMIDGLWFGGPSYKRGSVNGGLAAGPTLSSGVVVDDIDYRASNAWRHYVYTYDGTTRKVYVNNVEKYSGARGSLSSCNKFNFGHTNCTWCLGTNGNGYIDAFYFYNVALNTTEIGQLYNGGAGI
jgi:hypothetical protein